jgi:class 3 adenylate cyclase/tetratricopeptide (TPR) repeat protein
MRCPSCRADNRPGVRFCEQCGARLGTACASCGAPLAPSSRFCGECGAPAAAAAPAVPGAAARPAPESTAPPRFASPRAYTPPYLAERILKDAAALVGERKQVTVLFADVSGFTSLSERLDPEDVHALINRAFELMLAEIHRYEGTVNQFLGDGLMALFGAPVAHEDHARRAALAALAMQEALARFRDELGRTRGIDFRVRLGLNTGLVVVGAIGDNLRMDYTAVGDTTNIAARMQQLAEPGRIAVAEATERLIAPYFELHALGTFALKNREQPVAAWELRRARPGVSRLAARAARGLSPFVGRDDALATLERAWRAARAGRGQAVLVVGDPGSGQSRLLLELRRRLGDGAAWLEGDCVSFGQSVPFLPVAAMLRADFGVDDQDDERTVVEKIGRGVAVLGDEARSLTPYLRYLLSVDPGDPAVATMDPLKRRERIVAAILGLLAARSRRRPLALVIEDAHWIDPASEDALKAVMEAVPGLALLLVITHRPVYQPPFGDRTYCSRIALQPVDEDDAAAIMRTTLGVADVPGDVAGAIAARAEGNPFFLEELGRSLLESRAVEAEHGRLVLRQPAAALAVPQTVQDVIAARIDRLGEPQKRTVQTAAVIGREFGLSLLRRVAGPDEEIERSLRELKGVELIYEKPGFGDLEYVFRHALTQDVAYASLLQAERRRLHAEIGRAIEELYAGRLEPRTEELVWHFTRGEVWDKVARYGREAGERAAALCVDDRAIEHYRTALRALAHLPETEAAARAGVEVRLAMRAPLWRAGRPEELHALFTEAEALATRWGPAEALDTIYAFLVQYHWARGEQHRALEYGGRCLERAAARDDLGLRVTGLYYMAHACLSLGRHADAIRHAEEMLARLAGREGERFGLSGLPASGACIDASRAFLALGDVDRAWDLLRRGRAIADAAGHLYSQMVVAQMEGLLLTRTGRIPEAIAVLEATAATCREKNFVGQLINTLHWLGHAYPEAGRPVEAVQAVREAIDLQERAHVSVERTEKLTALMTAYTALGDFERAEAAFREALGYAERQGERAGEALAWLAAARLARRRGDDGEAERRLAAARAIAQELGLRPLLERAQRGAAP